MLRLKNIYGLTLVTQLTASDLKGDCYKSWSYWTWASEPSEYCWESSLKDHIHDIICGDDSSVQKPDQRVLGDLLGRWGVEPSQLIVIGDQHVDAQLALNLGASAIIVARSGVEFTGRHLSDNNWQEYVTAVSSLHDVRL